MKVWITRSSFISAQNIDGGSEIDFVELGGVLLAVYKLGKHNQKKINIAENFFGDFFLTGDTSRRLLLTCLFELAENIDVFQQRNRIIIKVGSARGTTALWEHFHENFILSGTVSPETSPLTTFGNLSSGLVKAVRQFFCEEMLIFANDLSSTCNSSAVAVADGYAWLKAGMCDMFLACGCEMPITAFTLAQMKALRIYTSLQEFPVCKPFNSQRVNTFALGSGAGILQMIRNEYAPSAEAIEIETIGYASENPTTLTGISSEAIHISSALKAAIQDLNPEDPKIDLIISHSPGTVKGDLAEFTALNSIFGDKLPYVYPSKFLTGHTFGAAAILSIGIAIEIFKGTKPRLPEYDSYLTNPSFPENVKRIVVISAGFGGMAMCIILKKTK